MILTIEDDGVLQRCALCERQRRIPQADLPKPEASTLTLPACECGAVESLIGAPPGEPPHPSPGSVGHRHRLLVDALLAAQEAPSKKRRPLIEAARAALAKDAHELFPGGLHVEPLPSPIDEREMNES
ncbi:MAG: hypothetical protein AB7K71_17075 [Polyangiaceae bacterium]